MNAIRIISSLILTNFMSATNPYTTYPTTYPTPYPATTYPCGYDMITDTIAIGDKYSSYEFFDIIVNLKFPLNNVLEKDIHITKYLDKTVYYIGVLEDSNQGVMLSLIKELIPELALRKQNNPNLRVLFHCFDGISRSATMAIAYLVKSLQISLDDALYISKIKRPIIQINQVFLRELEMYLL